MDREAARSLLPGVKEQTRAGRGLVHPRVAGNETCPDKASRQNLKHSRVLSVGYKKFANDPLNRRHPRVLGLQSLREHDTSLRARASQKINRPKTQPIGHVSIGRGRLNIHRKRTRATRPPLQPVCSPANRRRTFSLTHRPHRANAPGRKTRDKPLRSPACWRRRKTRRRRRRRKAAHRSPRCPMRPRTR